MQNKTTKFMNTFKKVFFCFKNQITSDDTLIATFFLYRISLNDMIMKIDHLIQK